MYSLVGGSVFIKYTESHMSSKGIGHMTVPPYECSVDVLGDCLYITRDHCILPVHISVCV